MEQPEQAAAPEAEVQQQPAAPVNGQQEATTEAPPPAPPPPEPSYQWWLLPMIALLWVWWLFGSRKQKKQQKERQDELSALGKGDQIITIGRVHGKVVSVSEDTVTFQPDEKHPATMTVDKVAIYKIQPKGKPAEGKAGS